MKKQLKSRELHIRLTQNEWMIFKKKLEQSKYKNMTEFIIRSVLGKEIFIVDVTQYLDIKWLLSNVSNNINQIAKVANTSGYVGEDDINKLKYEYTKMIVGLEERFQDLHDLLLEVTNNKEKY